MGILRGRWSSARHSAFRFSRPEPRDLSHHAALLAGGNPSVFAGNPALAKQASVEIDQWRSVSKKVDAPFADFSMAPASESWSIGSLASQVSWKLTGRTAAMIRQQGNVLLTLPPSERGYKSSTYKKIMARAYDCRTAESLPWNHRNSETASVFLECFRHNPEELKLLMDRGKMSEPSSQEADRFWTDLSDAAAKMTSQDPRPSTYYNYRVFWALLHYWPIYYKYIAHGDPVAAGRQLGEGLAGIIQIGMDPANYRDSERRHALTVCATLMMQLDEACEQSRCFERPEEFQGGLVADVISSIVYESCIPSSDSRVIALSKYALSITNYIQRLPYESFASGHYEWPLSTSSVES